MRNIYVGDVGVAVQYLQLALKRAGYLKEISGQFNRETCNALKAFMGEGVGCYVDRAVWARLTPYLSGYTTHVITAGETLWGIADTYDTLVSAILTANPSLDAMNLQIGTRIYVPFSFALVDEQVPYLSLIHI